MSRRSIGFLVMGIGVVILVVAALADPLGVGGADETFGWKQIVGVVVGAIVVVAGIVLAVTGRTSTPSDATRG